MAIRTSHNSPLERLWDRLAGVHRLSFVAQSALATGWNGAGHGDVVVTRPAADVLLFHETGTWQSQGGTTLPFRNVFRWTQKGAVLQLEHLRFGPDAPVLLCDLARQPDGCWHAVAPHRCKADRYTASLTMQREEIVLVWHINGPQKHEHLAYRYAPLNHKALCR